MSEKTFWFDEIVEKNPVVFKNLQYIECSEGWSILIKNCASTIEHYIKRKIPKDEQENYYATQVKQKFGGLRFYFSQPDPFIDGVIELAEIHSFYVCEKCGNSATKRNIKNYLITLCDSHCQEANNLLENNKWI